MSAVQSARPIFEDERAAVRQAVPNNATFVILSMSAVCPVETVDNSHCADEVSTCVDGDTNRNK
eukprot:3459612-Pleurochrysis_carterae.AAC.1